MVAEKDRIRFDTSKGLLVVGHMYAESKPSA